MKNVIIGAVGGLILGTVGALAVSSYLNDQKLADLQTQLDAANASLAKSAKDKKQLSMETSGVSDQVDQLVSSNEELKKELAAAKTAAPQATGTDAASVNPATLAGMMMGMMRGGGFQTAQRAFLLQTRLHLTPEQSEKIKAAMEADAKSRGELMRSMFRNGGKPDPALAAKANTLDATLDSVLTLQQKDQYKQVQTEEKVSRADTAATIQVNQVAPLLQLTDAQKDQVFSALYQVQMGAPEPGSLLTNPNPAGAFMGQAQDTQAALAKVLTGDQMNLYQQQAQSMTAQMAQGGFGGGRRNGGQGGNGGQGNRGAQADANGGGGAAPAAVAPAATPASSTDASATNAATTNAPSATDATTNAAPAATDGSSTNAAPTTNAASGSAPQQ